MTKLAGLPAWVSTPDPSIYRSNNYVVLDFETTTILKGSALADDNRIVLACWDKYQDTGVALPGRGGNTYDCTHKQLFANEFGMAELVRDCEEADFIVAHNSKFELGWLRRCGLDLRGIIVFDTLTAEYVLGGNSLGLHQLGLNKCLERHGLKPKLDTIGLMLKNKIDTEDMPESWLLRYCKRDVAACGELFLKQLALLEKKGLEAVNYQRCLVTPALADIEFNGMQLDKKEVLRYEEELEREYAQLTIDLQRFCDGASPSSTKQMQEFIYSTLGFRIPRDFRGNEYLTPGGDPSVAAPVMEKLVASTERQRAFLALHRKWGRVHSDLTKYIRKFADCVRMDDGSLRGTFNQCSTKTHRLSSSGLKHRVQFQNFSRGFKPYFIARNKDWLIGEADGAQLEFRVATHLGKDRVALGDIVHGTDIHKYTASIIGCSRQEAKPHTFKPLYGGTSGAPNERAYYDAFKEKYHGIAKTQEGWTQDVLRDKCLRTEWGLKYYWPNTRMGASGYITNTTSIYNYPVQAFATAEIIPCAIVAAWHRMKNMDSFLVNTVHDSIIAELKPSEVSLWHEIAKQCLITDAYKMIKDLYGVELTVPLGAGVTVDRAWGSKAAKDGEVVYEADESLWREAAVKEGMIDE